MQRQRDWLQHKYISVELGLDLAVHFQHRMKKRMSLCLGSSASHGGTRHNVKGWCYPSRHSISSPGKKWLDDCCWLL